MDYFAFSFLRLKSAKNWIFVVIGVASRSVSSVAPRDEENVAGSGAILLGHILTNFMVFLLFLLMRKKEAKKSTVGS